MPVAQTVSFVQITNLSDLSNSNSDALHTCLVSFWILRLREDICLDSVTGLSGFYLVKQMSGAETRCSLLHLQNDCE